MDCTFVDNFDISDSDTFPIRVIGEISSFASDLLNDEEFNGLIEDEEIIFNLKGSNNKSTYFSECINNELILDDLIPTKLIATYEQPLIVNMMYNYTRDVTNDIFTTPSIIFSPITGGKKETRRVTLCIDILFLIPHKIKLSAVSKTFISGIGKQILQFKNSYNFLNAYLDDVKTVKLIAIHYRIDTNFVTLIVPENELSHEEKWRQQVSRELKLERTLQRTQSLYPPREVFAKMTNNGEKLVCPHTSINVTFPESHVVLGRYTYHHYLQDGTDDKGWGCAYRSLQTIVSWFVWQGWSKVAVPSHREIQASLVRMKDKEPSFMGSRAWIGSFEINLVLQDLIGLESRIISLARGSELAGTFDQLAEHFDDGGAPVMIGGGQLAHTILGVSRDRGGKARFLVLDPHFTGPSGDLAAVLAKGWCAWKEPTFWKDGLPYNLCLPGRVPLK